MSNMMIFPQTAKYVERIENRTMSIVLLGTGPQRKSLLFENKRTSKSKSSFGKGKTNIDKSIFMILRI